MQVISPRSLGGDTQELKEAVCDAVANLTTDSVSGSGPTGEVVYGRSPRRAFVAGLLLPRFDQQGEDDTSDIRVSTLGIDLHILSNATDTAELRPLFATYVRVLPTWQEVNHPRYGLELDFRLDPALELLIKNTIIAERRRIFADEGLNRPDPKEMPLEERRQRRARRTAIRSAVTQKAYADHGIELTVDDAAAVVAAASGTDTSAASTSEAADTATQGEPNPNQPSSETEGADTVPISMLQRRGRRVPIARLLPADIPSKWRRLPLLLPAFSWTLASTGQDLRRDVDRFSAEMRAAATASVRAWLLSAEGVEQAWRDIQVMPADSLTEDSWNAFLQRVRSTAPQPDQLMPEFGGLRIGVDKMPNYADPSISSLRVTLENDNQELSGRAARRRTETIFQARLELRTSQRAHRALTLDRVEPSYRFRDHLNYPAMGLNCGVVAREEGHSKILATTWAPRFVQPRIIARAFDMPLTFTALADPNKAVDELLLLPRQYRDWIAGNEAQLRIDVRRGLSQQDADAESRRLETDLANQRREARYIERGIELLAQSQAAAQQLAKASRPQDKARLALLAAPWRAWILMNRTYARRENGNPERGWRLFQIAFVLAHVPTLVSRMPEYKEWHDPDLDETSASLLYFPTGGGKSEAFYGTLIYAMFLDRLRGKNRGVTGFIRYPLRLLTLQQAQRFLRLLVHAERIRKDDHIGTWPFEIGFWVGKTNTPNRFSQVSAQIPDDANDEHPDDANLIPDRLPDDADDDVVQRAQTYEDSLLAYNKIPRCPLCGEATGLRRVLSDGDTARRLAIFCFKRSCEWNTSHATRTPLPFLLTDDAIYQRAPSVVLGTIDKMAMLGQNTETIAQLLGMFGLARWIGPTGHLSSPRLDKRLEEGAEASGCRTVSPAYRDGVEIFHDPFPSLIIQDEAHLLEESLGTFSGLFETLLDLVFTRINEIAGDRLTVARAWNGAAWGLPRTPKIIAATATVSDPDRQLEVLYQRLPLRFPYPGPDIYHSFFAIPAPVPVGNPIRAALERSLPPALSPEAAAPWMRLYISLMTNGATHTMTTVSVLSAFHLIITGLWRGLNDPTLQAAAIAEIRAAISAGEAGDWRRAAIDRAVAGNRQNAILALIDLHRIALTYVTNKKGGDQIMDALDLQVKRDHRAADAPITAFDARLISGGIDMRTIQQIMVEAETELPPGSEYPDIDRQMRSIIATSAISHGVDVDRFNSMFFAGLPSDVAEYIQASSRVGRTHVGFVMLVPTPQSRRDRYVVETHDIFHRFLERMIAPPAVQRWASNAIKRVTASVIQSWSVLKEAQGFQEAPNDRKHLARRFDIMRQLNALAVADALAMRDELGSYMLQAIGYGGRGPNGIGQPVYREVYRDLADRAMSAFVSNVSTFNSQIRLAEFWSQNSGVQAPMTSLRDVDEAGLIVPSTFDPYGAGGNRRVRREAFVDVMKAIRTQKGTAAETDREGEEPAREAPR